MTFDSFKPLYTVVAKVTTPDGKDVTSDVDVEWIKPLADGSSVYLRKAVSLGEVPDGQALICRVSLGDELAASFMMPDDTEFVVDGYHKTCNVALVPFRSIDLSGSVVDADGAPMKDVSVSVSQTLNGKYTKSFAAKTDRNGIWSLTVYDAPESRLVFSSDECVSVNSTIGAFASDQSAFDMGKTLMKSIVGARVSYGFTYRAAGASDVQDYYSDWQNVTVDVYNVTQNRSLDEISLQYPLIAVLDENINAGDVLRLTAASKTGEFRPVVQSVTVGDNQRASVTFDIVGKGGIVASYEMTDNPAVVALLYSSNGELFKKSMYEEANVAFADLDDGDYTLVSMGQSDLMNSVLRLSGYAEVGLMEGRDYVADKVKVENGKLSDVKIRKYRFRRKPFLLYQFIHKLLGQQEQYNNRCISDTAFHCRFQTCLQGQCFKCGSGGGSS